MMAIFEQLFQVLAGAQTEIAIFLVAFSIHVLMFGTHRVKKESKRARTSEKGGAVVHEGKARTATTLLRGVRSLLREESGWEAIASELQDKLQKHAGEDASFALVGLLEGLGRAATPAVLQAVRETCSRLGLGSNPRLCELLLRGYLTAESWDSFKELLAEAGKEGISTPGISVMCLRAAVKSSDLEAAICALKKLSSKMQDSANGSASAAPQQLLQQTIQLAVEKASLPKLLVEISDTGLLVPWVVEALLRECAKAGDAEGLRASEELARKRNIELTAAAYATLIREASEPSVAQRLLSEALASGVERAAPIAAAADLAAARGDASLAGVVLEHFRESPSPLAAAALVRLTADGILAGKDPDSAVLELYEKHLKGCSVLAELRSNSVRLVAEASMRQRRFDVLKQVLAVTGENFRPAVLLKSLGEEHRVEDAFAIFDACPEKTALLYNALLDACIDGRDIAAAEKVMAKAISSGVADVVTYNTIIKAHAQTGDSRRARAGLEAMRAAGHVPNHVTFNELIDAQLKAKRESVWGLIEEMKACGLQPNQVTCSILLKNVVPGTRDADVRKTLEIVGDLESEMDEVLLSSLCEACVRIRRSDLLEKHLRRQRGQNGVQINSAYTYGSVIRAYGFMQDLNGVWNAWSEMRSKDILPTSTTLGCMVEALVMNDSPDAGYNLIREVLLDEKVKPLVNAIVYCSVLKGFCHTKRFDRVWSVYKEMQGLKLKFSLVTYNTLIDACARCREVDRVPALLKEMAKQGIEPNVITYSTILKGHCQENRLDKAFELLEKMKQTSGIAPDDFTYNTLLDGCACHGLLERGLAVLDDMERSGVRPSNFTLSLAAKLGNRGRSVDTAFRLCEDLAKKYNLSWNVHVYNNLLHACTAHRDVWRALPVFAQMNGGGVRPDVRTYTLLLKGLLEAGEVEEAACLLRAAYGLEAFSPSMGKLNTNTALLRGGLPEDLISEVLKGIAAYCGDERMVQLLRDLRRAPGFKINPKLPLQLTSQAIQMQ